MAQLALTVAGSAVGSYFGGPIGGMIGAQLGSMAGALIDQAIFGASAIKQTGPRVNDLLVQNASYGQPIAHCWGQVALAGNLIWQRPLKEVRSTRTQSSGGKGSSGPSAKNVTYSYYGNFAVGVCAGQIASFGRIWADGKLIRDAGGGGKYNGTMTFYTGTETQAPDPTIQSYEGVGATPAYRGLAYIVFTDLPLADFGNRVPNFKIEVISKAGAEAAFDSAFVGKTRYIYDTYGPSSGAHVRRSYGHATDSFGNYILSDDNYHHQVVAIRPDLSVAWDLSAVQMADMVDGFAGTAIVDHTDPEVYLGHCFGAPVAAGNKLLLSFQSYWAERGHFCQWVMITDAVASGTPNVLGVVRYDKVLNGVPFGDVRADYSISTAGNQTEDDPILITGQGNYTGLPVTVVVLPSVNEITSGVYTGGWGSPLPPANWRPYEVPYLQFSPIGGSTSFADKLYWAAQWNGNTNGNCGFCLPLLDLSNPSVPQARTLWHCYVNRGFTEWCLDPVISDSLKNPEVRDVLGPAYPNGCMVRVDLGVVAFAALAMASLVDTAHAATLTTPAYTVVNADWQLSAGGAALPFTDEYHYLSNGGAGGKDAYQTQPALIEKQVDGSFLVIFTMMGVSDAELHDDHLMWAAARPFLYDPATGIARQVARLAGPIYADSDVGATGLAGSGAFYDDAATIVYHTGDALYFWGHLGGAGLCYVPGTTYFSKFGTLSLTGDISLDEIVGDLCDFCGLEAATDYDASALRPQRVRGYAVGRESDARAAIEPLREAFFFDGVESDGKVKWAFRGGAAIGAIAESDLAARSGGDAVARVGETRKQDHELPARMIVKYVDVDRDFQIGAQQAKRIAQTMGSRDQQTADVPIVMTAAEAILVAQKGLYLAWIMRTQYAIALPLAYLRYDPADVLTLTWKPATGLDPVGTTQVPLYVTEIAFGADGVLELRGAGTDEVVYLDSTAPGSGSTFIGQSTGAIEPATLALIDLPPLRDADDDVGFYYAMAGASDSWRGGALYRSPDGVSYTQVASSDAPTPMGFAATALPSGPTTVHDDVNTVTVRLSYGALESVTRAQSLNGANAALLGDEILTFDTATPLGGTDWQLSGLMRGRKGTEWATGSHVIGERFVLLDTGTIGRVVDPMAWCNTALHYKAVSAGLAIASAGDTLFTDTGASLKPYAPVAIAGSRDGSNNLTITWIRRARLYAEWSDGVDVPLDEPAEAYEVDILDGDGAVLRTIMGLRVPSASYLAAEQTADFGAPQSNIAVAVYQLSSRVGRGFAGRAAV